MTHPDEMPVPDAEPENWGPGRRGPTPEHLALSGLLDRDEKMQAYMARLLRADPIKQSELKEMLGVLFESYFDMQDKLELALRAAEYAKKESAMNRRHAELAVGITKQLLSSVKDPAEKTAA